MTDFADRQRDRRAAGRTGTAALLDRLEASRPALREMAERLLAAPAVDPTDPLRVASEQRRAIAGLRMLNARRELAQTLAVLRDDPAHPDAPERRLRVLEITRWIKEAERTGSVPPYPWARLLAQEGRR